MSNKVKVLVVEDEIIIARDLQEMLEGMGYEVAGLAGTSEEALYQYKTQEPDLVLMDIILRGSRDGIDTARELQEKFGATIVFLTAHSDETTVLRAKSLSPSGYVLKPIKVRELQIQLDVANYVKQSNRIIREAGQWLEAVLDTLEGGALVTGLEDEVHWVNRALADMLGVTPGSLSGKKVGDILKTDRSDPAKATFRDAKGEFRVLNIAMRDLNNREGGRMGFLYLMEE